LQRIPITKKKSILKKWIGIKKKLKNNLKISLKKQLNKRDNFYNNFYNNIYRKLIIPKKVINNNQQANYAHKKIIKKQVKRNENNLLKSQRVKKIKKKNLYIYINLILFGGIILLETFAQLNAI